MIVARQNEIEVLDEAMNSSKAEMVALVGRRRIGKTYLVRQYFKDKIDFELVGIKDATHKDQLLNFSNTLSRYSKKDAQQFDFNNWIDAFFELGAFLDKLSKRRRRKMVFFFDELPWMATARSGFLQSFAHFWNAYASRYNVVMLICGSAASWMIKKVFADKGGLHNRVTKRIFMRPFTLEECELFLKAKNIRLDRYQMVQLYMALGGVPLYWDQVQKGLTAMQNIDALCFQPQGLLKTEFENLYRSLFIHPERYEQVVRVLSKSHKGLSRTEIVDRVKISDGGGLTNMLLELEQSGFISSYVPFKKRKKKTLYRLTDNYSLFYLKFIEAKKKNLKSDWGAMQQSQSYKIWAGYAFENVCMQHVGKIKQGLGISGVSTQVSSFYQRATTDTEGLQIDLLIDRMDKAISLCEIKFYDGEFVLSKSYAEKLRRRMWDFKALSKTRKQILNILITPFGINPNQYSIGLIDNVLTLDDLF